jgi:hypothetical protein
MLSYVPANRLVSSVPLRGAALFVFSEGRGRAWADYSYCRITKFSVFSEFTEKTDDPGCCRAIIKV